MQKVSSNEKINKTKFHFLYNLTIHKQNKNFVYGIEVEIGVKQKKNNTDTAKYVESGIENEKNAQ